MPTEKKFLKIELVDNKRRNALGVIWGFNPDQLKAQGGAVTVGGIPLFDVAKDNGPVARALVRKLKNETRHSFGSVKIDLSDGRIAEGKLVATEKTGAKGDFELWFNPQTRAAKDQRILWQVSGNHFGSVGRALTQELSLMESANGKLFLFTLALPPTWVQRMARDLRNNTRLTIGTDLETALGAEVPGTLTARPIKEELRPA